MKISLPQEIQDTQNSSILDINGNINEQLDEIVQLQSANISLNANQVEEILSKCSTLLSECHNLDFFKPAKNNNFQRLTYEYQSLKNKYENYKFDEKLQDVNIKIKILESKQEKLSTENNNLVYNILGFIASFSVVSSAVTAIINIENTLDIIIFMVFLSLILILTLITLNNFYKNTNYFRTKLQDNYFICKIFIILLIIFLICRGAQYFQNNLTNICESIGRGIGQFIQLKEQ